MLVALLPIAWLTFHVLAAFCAVGVPVLASALRRCERGTIFVEYLLIIALFTFPVVAAIYSIGLPLVRYSRYGEMILAGPVP